MVRDVANIVTVVVSSPSEPMEPACSRRELFINPALKRTSPGGHVARREGFADLKGLAAVGEAISDQVRIPRILAKREESGKRDRFPLIERSRVEAINAERRRMQLVVEFPSDSNHLSDVSPKERIVSGHARTNVSKMNHVASPSTYECPVIGARAGAG